MKYKIIPSLLFILGVVSLFSYVLSDNIFENIYVNIVYLLSSFCAVYLGFNLMTEIGFKGKKSNIYLLIVIGVSLWFLGDALWSIYTIILDLDPFPSYIDIIYLSSYPLFFVAFLKEYRLNKINWTIKKIFIVTILSLAFGWLVLYYGVYSAFDAEASLFENIFSILYGVADLALLIMLMLVIVIITSYKDGKYFMVWAYFLLAVMFTLFADVLYALYYNYYEEGIRSYQFIDLLWILGFLFFAQGFYRAREIIIESQNKILDKLNKKVG